MAPDGVCQENFAPKAVVHAELNDAIVSVFSGPPGGLHPRSAPRFPPGAFLPGKSAIQRPSVAFLPGKQDRLVSQSQQPLRPDRSLPVAVRFTRRYRVVRQDGESRVGAVHVNRQPRPLRCNVAACCGRSLLLSSPASPSPVAASRTSTATSARTPTARTWIRTVTPIRATCAIRMRARATPERIRRAPAIACLDRPPAGRSRCCSGWVLRPRHRRRARPGLPSATPPVTQI